jgi:hypothetical protein
VAADRDTDVDTCVAFVERLGDGGVATFDGVGLASGSFWHGGGGGSRVGGLGAGVEERGGGGVR